MGIDDQSVGGFLTDLASSSPAPGGGAAAGMQVALGAALVSMVCNLTIGKPRYAAHEDDLRAARDEAERARVRALDLADADAAAFSAVSDAYRLPKTTEDERARRSRAIQEALRGAAAVPLQTAGLAAEVVDLCRRILPGANVNVLSDVAVAAASARAGLASAAVNVRVNLAAMSDPAAREELVKELDAYLPSLLAADGVVRDVENRIGS